MTTTNRPGRSAVMVDVARRAGVSQKTVSRVVNDAPHVRPDVRERVLAAIDELNYRPNVAARSLVTQRTHVIGMLVVGVALFGPAARVFSIERAARAKGYDLALASIPDTSGDTFAHAVRSLLDRNVEGIILEVPNHDIVVDQSIFGGVPLASSVGRIAGVDRQAVISSEQQEAGQKATRHLLDLGHETVWHIAGPPTWDASLSRRTGWLEALDEAGRRRPEVLQGDWSARSGYHHGQFLATRDDVTAVFTANDAQAMGLLRAFAEAGRSVPGDVSVVGFDDVPEAEFQMVPLSTMRLDHEELSRQILSTLVALIEGGDPVPERPLIPELVVRKSSGPPRSPARA